MIKTAGTTLHYIFRNNFGYNYVEVQKNIFTIDDLRTLLSINKNIRAIGGHSLRSVDNLDEIYQDLKYITFLRNPVNRFLSHYNHGKIYKHHNMSLEERIRVPGEANYQTKFILGKKGLKEREFVVSEDDVEKAKRIIDRDFKFVGIVEEFDESLLLMKRVLNLNIIFYEKKNIMKRRFATGNKISDYLMKKIKEVNKLDYELYNFAKNKLYELKKNTYGDNFIEDLRNFKRLNINYRFNRSNIFKFRLGKYLVYSPLLYIRSHLQPS